MNLSAEQIMNFQSLYRNHFGIDLTVQEALEKALPLVTLMKATFQPMKEEDMLHVQERRQKLFSN